MKTTIAYSRTCDDVRHSLHMNSSNFFLSIMTIFENFNEFSFFLALNKVDKLISEFMVQLKEKLFEFPSVLEEQRRLIR